MLIQTPNYDYHQFFGNGWKLETKEDSNAPTSLSVHRPAFHHPDLKLTLGRMHERA